MWMFAATMFALGIVLEPRDLNETLKRPKAIGLGVLTQFTIMPLLGFAAAWFSDLPPTLAIEIGMQNAGLGVVLAMKHFSAETALPGALFAVWCILTSAGASAWLRRHHKH